MRCFPACGDRSATKASTSSSATARQVTPLAGVVRIRAPAEAVVDVVVGHAAWQRDLLERAELLEVAGSSVRVARTADLVLLKLYAGGPTDRWDIDRLLEIAADCAA